MNPEEKRMLEKAVTLSEENNMILRKMRRSAQWATAFKTVYWVVIIGAAVGVFYFAEPYIKAVTSTYGQFKDDVSAFQRFVK